jgi:hypothetical protein
MLGYCGLCKIYLFLLKLVSRLPKKKVVSMPAKDFFLNYSAKS